MCLLFKGISFEASRANSAVTRAYIYQIGHDTSSKLFFETHAGFDGYYIYSDIYLEQYFRFNVW